MFWILLILSTISLLLNVLFLSEVRICSSSARRLSFRCFATFPNRVSFVLPPSFEQSRANVVLARRAAALTKQTGRVHAPVGESAKEDFVTMVRLSISRPIGTSLFPFRGLQANG